MTSIDIVNQLDPDVIKCIITNKWVKLNDRCQWNTSTAALSINNYWKCINHCPRILWNDSKIQIIKDEKIVNGEPKVIV